MHGYLYSFYANEQQRQQQQQHEQQKWKKIQSRIKSIKWNVFTNQRKYKSIFI